MLNDTPETVQAWYRQFRVEQHLKKATDFNAQLFGNGAGKRMAREGHASGVGDVPRGRQSSGLRGMRVWATTNEVCKFL